LLRLSQAALFSAPLLSSQREGFLASVQRQVEATALRASRASGSSSDDGDARDYPYWAVGPPSPRRSDSGREGDGSSENGGDSDEDGGGGGGEGGGEGNRDINVGRQEVAGRGQSLLLRVAQMNEAAAAAAESAAAAAAATSASPPSSFSAAASTAPPLSLAWRGAMTTERLALDAGELALGWSLQSKPAAYSSLVSLQVVRHDPDDGHHTPVGTAAADGEWADQFLSVSDASVWAATYFSVSDGAVSTAAAASSSVGRFRFVADLAARGCAVTFEACPSAATGFCVAVHQPHRGFSVKLAPRKFKQLLDWGAALLQAVSELPPPPAREYARTLALAQSSSAHGHAGAAAQPGPHTPKADEPRTSSRERRRYSASAPRSLPPVAEERSALPFEASAARGEVPWPLGPPPRTFGEAPDGASPWGVAPSGAASRPSPKPTPRLLHMLSAAPEAAAPMAFDRSLTRRGLWISPDDASGTALAQSLAHYHSIQAPVFVP
jgi:hypothetical protein